MDFDGMGTWGKKNVSLSHQKKVDSRKQLLENAKLKKAQRAENKVQTAAIDKIKTFFKKQ